MKQKPRDSRKTILQNGNAIQIVIFAIIQTLIILGAFLAGKHFYGESAANAMAFYALNMVQMIFIFCVRTDDSIFKSNPFKNRWVNITVLLAFAILNIIAFTPIKAIIHIGEVNIWGLMICFGMGFLVIPFSEIYKIILKLIRKNKQKNRLIYSGKDKK